VQLWLQLQQLLAAPLTATSGTAMKEAAQVSVRP